MQACKQVWSLPIFMAADEKMSSTNTAVIVRKLPNPPGSIKNEQAIVNRPIRMGLTNHALFEVLGCAPAVTRDAMTSFACQMSNFTIVVLVLLWV